ncbi:DUF4160 domain-containing protein [Chlorobium phaeobacteroides]|uniref:Uncharacterized protein n=1 Tax=Chlorobium phaeobacteroides (strain DSM 266 / SMG 266 / 2430) TaxID=290317 RepID=A1BIH4_CHLPD|nr:DUF4160 domain-containing protein [Chlorobium phaeobacteroides]ABL66201.1 hypothetical protein Cpha266_2200 [Chlorobium phaeobacteroides DSM 266]
MVTFSPGIQVEPEIELAKNSGYSRIQLKQIESIVEVHSDELCQA